MRLKTFTAPSMTEAMALVREELGDDAIIVSTQRNGAKGVRITAALEAREPEDDFEAMFNQPEPARHDFATPVQEALDYHGTPPRLAERLVGAVRAMGLEDPVMAFAAALDASFAFAPLPERGAARPIMLVGVPGAGKTVTVAKLAARATLAGHKVRIITTDAIRAGAVEQLAAFTKILEIELGVAKNGAGLAKALASRPPGELCFIDSAGINPFFEADLALLGELVVSGHVEPVLVQAAGGDPLEASDIAEAFAALGTTRLLATRLDMARRLGALLSAADAGPLKFCDVSISPHVANGLSALNPVSLARLLLPNSSRSGNNRSYTEALS